MAEILKIPSFIVKNGQQKPPQNRGGFCCVLGFFFLNFSVFFFSFLLISCCFMTSWNPKTEGDDFFIFIENPRRGCLLAGWGARGAEGVLAGNFRGGGLNIFWGGRNSHQDNLLVMVINDETQLKHQALCDQK